MKFLDNNIQDYNGTDFDVFKDSNGIATLQFKNNPKFFINNLESYNKVFLGKQGEICETCDSFYKDSFNGFTYDSVLVAGLGLGLIPQELYQIDNCSKVDVIEINQEVIDYINTSGHVDSNINLIQGDIYSYTTSEKYDLIIIDIIWRESEMDESQWQILENKFINNLNSGGVLYSPINKKWVTL